MDKPHTELDKLLHSLHERAKELNCLYQIEEILRDYESDIEDIIFGIIKAVPAGWQYPEVCRCRITYEKRQFYPPEFSETEWTIASDIRVLDSVLGKIEIFYIKEMPETEFGMFLPEEIHLLETIADRLGSYIQHQSLSRIRQDLERAKDKKQIQQRAEWEFVVDLLERTDQEFYFKIARKLLNMLCRSGISEANTLIKRLGSDFSSEIRAGVLGENQPQSKDPNVDLVLLSREILKLASEHMRSSEILGHVQDWMQEERASFLIKAISNPASSLAEIISAVRRFVHMSPEKIDLPDFVRKGIRVSLLHRTISDDLNYIRHAKEYIDLYEFHKLLSKLIYPSNSRGRLGGKSAGLFLASAILKDHSDEKPVLKGIKTPKTWYVTSDAQLNFMHYNNLDEIPDQKYKDIAQIRQEYPHIIQLFKNSNFPPEMVQGIAMALDDFGDKPLVVRSSSLLEDRSGSAFSGKYKSLFVANQGTKAQRMNALMDAIAEVYSSTFGPDPIEYRAERGLLDFYEEMSIMIQEVVGSRVGKYFLPSYAGVAFSNNEFRWSPRIDREDGLLRIVPGLGTRAVDRLSDDYPVLLAPGQPGLHVNVTADEIMRYSPQKIDVINLEENRFETLDVVDFLKECGDDLPAVEKMISLVRLDHLQKPPLMGVDFNADPFVITFRPLIEETNFVERIYSVLETLQTAMETPVDIEFASDGKDFYLLQCRPQNALPGDRPAPIPVDLPDSAYLFTADRYVSNGSVPEITHVVYIEPEAYGELESLKDLHDVGRAVGELNKLLPKRQFILMGPGRWGSRGDIKLGVNVTYSEINNTAVLIEIARRTGKYLPDLSFGTHFFQDLVEASIRYLPLYPDEPGIKFNESFLLNSDNILTELLPHYKHLEKAIRVIDVPANTHGKVLKVFMNADLDQAVGVLSQPSGQPIVKPELHKPLFHHEEEKQSPDHWQWRLAMAERIARNINPDEFGVEAMWVFGSTKNGTAGPSSDIDLLLRFRGNDEQKKSLLQWMKGWSLCLDELNYLRTGYRSSGLLDVHLLTDDDIANQTSFAIKIGAITDSARELPMGPE
ncbi:nucleotidyltransferase domain-containing protein [bacterium]|nr:nucleotidyltransferase domain-containing protein [bacterium]